MKMGHSLRFLVGCLVAISMIGGVLAPTAAQAQSRPARTAILRWSPSYRTFDVTYGERREFFFTARFYTGAKLHNAFFTTSIGAGIHAQPATIFVGTVQPHEWHDIAFTLVVPAGLGTGYHMGTLRLGTRENKHDYDVVGVPLTFAVLVHPRVTPQASIAWSPSNGLGTLTVQRGQTLTETVSFSSNKALTNAQLQDDLGNFAQANGVSISVPGIPSTVPANTPIGLTFAIAATANARVGSYDADLHVMGSANGGAAIHQTSNLTFKVDVDAPVVAPSMIYWTSIPGAVTLQAGQTVTVTTAFSSSTQLNGAAVMTALSNGLTARGLSIAVVATNMPTTIMPGTVVPVSLAITAAPTASTGGGTAYVDVHALNTLNVMALVQGVLNFPVTVIMTPAPLVSWVSGSPASFPSITRSTTSTVMVTEQATFTTSGTLTNAQLVTSVQPALAGGPSIMAAQLPPNTTVAANTPTTINVIISVPSTAKSGLYTGQVYLIATSNGSTVAVRIHNALHYAVAVN